MNVNWVQNIPQAPGNGMHHVGSNNIKTFESKEFWPSSWVRDFFFAECVDVAETGLRTQPVASAVSATGGGPPTCAHTHTHFSREHIDAHSTRGSRYKERVCHLSFLSCVMSLLFPPHLPLPVSFTCTLCSPPAPTSPPSATSTSTARIRQRSPCASACHWRESGPLTDFAPNTGHEPTLSAKVADSFSYLDFMHNPTAFQQHKVCP